MTVSDSLVIYVCVLFLLSIFWVMNEQVLNCKITFSKFDWNKNSYITIDPLLSVCSGTCVCRSVIRWFWCVQCRLIVCVCLKEAVKHPVTHTVNWGQPHLQHGVVPHLNSVPKPRGLLCCLHRQHHNWDRRLSDWFEVHKRLMYIFYHLTLNLPLTEN